jgi:hypothetical protein
MNEWLLRQYVKHKTAQNVLRTEHHCKDCHHTGKVVRRVSVLYLAGYVLLCILAGIFINWLIAFLVFVVSFFVVVKTAKPQCAKCFSTNISIPKRIDTTVNES